ncbi:MAG: GNAT family N-acetyltransferase [Candidatus Omnitrophica bacterium]|nr:GNAT family N-acetyltransferase [Candidatus Omnitrophota bacterium]
MAPAATVPSAPAAEGFYLSGRLTVPPELGTLREFRAPASDQPFVIFIQDAHATVDAQIHIRDLIGYLNRACGVRLVALEGGAGRIDPAVLRAFPASRKKRLAFRGYLERGEVTGAQLAAVFGPEADFYGLEDTRLYEKNYRAYLRSAAGQEEINRTLEDLRARLDAERKRVYTAGHNAFHEKADAFRNDRLDWLEFLRFLGESPAVRGKTGRYPELSRLLASLGRTEALDADQLAASARELGRELLRSHGRRFSARQLKIARARHQEFMTGRLDTASYLKYLSRLALSRQIPAAWTPAQKELLDEAASVAAIKGSRVFGEIESLLRETERGLVSGPEAERISSRYEYLIWLRRLAQLEMSREDWKAYQEKRGAVLDFFSRADLLEPAEEFYRTALARDGALENNLSRLLKKTRARSVVVLAGGFHTGGFFESLKAKGYSYALITPRIDSLRGSDRYAPVLMGDVSYKSFLETTAYDAFLKHAAKALTDGLNEPDLKRILRQWRRDLLGALGRQGRLDKAAEYTPYIDRLAAEYAQKYGSSDSRRAKDQLSAAAEPEWAAFRARSVRRIREQSWKKLGRLGRRFRASMLAASLDNMIADGPGLFENVLRGQIPKRARPRGEPLAAAALGSAVTLRYGAKTIPADLQGDSRTLEAIAPAIRELLLGNRADFTDADIRDLIRLGVLQPMVDGADYNLISVLYPGDQIAFAVSDAGLSEARDPAQHRLAGRFIDALGLMQARRERAAAAVWKNIASRYRSLDELRQVPAGDFGRAFGMIEVAGLAGPGVYALVTVTDEIFRQIERLRQQLAEDREKAGDSFRAPEEFAGTQWFESPEIRGPGMYLFTGQIEREKELGENGFFIGKSALFHELVESEFARDNIAGDEVLLGGFTLHQDFSVLRFELEFAALLGEEEFAGAVRSRKVEVDRLGRHPAISQTPEFAAYRDRVNQFLAQADFTAFRAAAEAEWHRAAGPAKGARGTASSLGAVTGLKDGFYRISDLASAEAFLKGEILGINQDIVLEMQRDELGEWSVVAIADGQVVGYVVNNPESEIPNTGDRYLEIEMMAVRPDPGTRRQLLAATEQVAREEGRTRLVLEVEAGNEAAENLYLDDGFQYRKKRRAGYNAMMKKVRASAAAEKASFVPGWPQLAFESLPAASALGERRESPLRRRTAAIVLAVSLFFGQFLSAVSAAPEAAVQAKEKWAAALAISIGANYALHSLDRDWARRGVPAGDTRRLLTAALAPLPSLYFHEFAHAQKMHLAAPGNFRAPEVSRIYGYGWGNLALGVGSGLVTGKLSRGRFVMPLHFAGVDMGRQFVPTAEYPTLDAWAVKNPKRLQEIALAGPLANFAFAAVSQGTPGSAISANMAAENLSPYGVMSLTGRTSDGARVFAEMPELAKIGLSAGFHYLAVTPQGRTALTDAGNVLGALSAARLMEERGPVSADSRWGFAVTPSGPEGRGTTSWLTYEGRFDLESVFGNSLGALVEKPEVTGPSEYQAALLERLKEEVSLFDSISLPDIRRSASRFKSMLAGSHVYSKPLNDAYGGDGHYLSLSADGKYEVVLLMDAAGHDMTSARINHVLYEAIRIYETAGIESPVSGRGRLADRIQAAGEERIAAITTEFILFLNHALLAYMDAIDAVNVAYYLAELRGLKPAREGLARLLDVLRVKGLDDLPGSITALARGLSREQVAKIQALPPVEIQRKGDGPERVEMKELLDAMHFMTLVSLHVINRRNGRLTLLQAGGNPVIGLVASSGASASLAKKEQEITFAPLGLPQKVPLGDVRPVSVPVNPFEFPSYLIYSTDGLMDSLLQTETLLAQAFARMDEMDEEERAAALREEPARHYEALRRMLELGQEATLYAMADGFVQERVASGEPLPSAEEMARHLVRRTSALIRAMSHLLVSLDKPRVARRIAREMFKMTPQGRGKLAAAHPNALPADLAERMPEPSEIAALPDADLEEIFSDMNLRLDDITLVVVRPDQAETDIRFRRPRPGEDQQDYLRQALEKGGLTVRALRWAGDGGFGDVYRVEYSLPWTRETRVAAVKIVGGKTAAAESETGKKFGTAKSAAVAAGNLQTDLESLRFAQANDIEAAPWLLGTVRDKTGRSLILMMEFLDERPAADMLVLHPEMAAGAERQIRELVAKYAARGYFLWDLNPLNFLLDRSGKLRFIDTGSFKKEEEFWDEDTLLKRLMGSDERGTLAAIERLTAREDLTHDELDRLRRRVAEVLGSSDPANGRLKQALEQRGIPTKIEARMAQSLGADARALWRSLDLPARLFDEEAGRIFAGAVAAWKKETDSEIVRAETFVRNLREGFERGLEAREGADFFEWLRDEAQGFPALARRLAAESAGAVPKREAEALILTVQFALFIGLPASARESPAAEAPLTAQDRARLAWFFGRDLAERIQILEQARRLMAASGRRAAQGFDLEALEFSPVSLEESRAYGFDYEILRAAFTGEASSYLERIAKTARLLVSYPVVDPEALDWIRALRVPVALIGHADRKPVTGRKIQQAGLFIASEETPVALGPGSVLRERGIHLGRAASRALPLPLLVGFVETVLFSTLRRQLADAGSNGFPRAPDDLAFRLMGLIADLLRFAESERLISTAA